MRAVIFSLSILALSVVACGGEDDTPFILTHDICAPLVLVPGEGATPDELHSLRSALGMWNALGGASLTLDDPDPSDGAIARIPVRFGEGAAVFYGKYNDRTGEVFVNRGLADHRQRAIVIAHELGHAFGLRHVAADSRTSVMNSGNLNTAPTQEDGAALRSLGACSETVD